MGAPGIKQVLILLKLRKQVTRYRFQTSPPLILSGAVGLTSPLHIEGAGGGGRAGPDVEKSCTAAQPFAQSERPKAEFESIQHIMPLGPPEIATQKYNLWGKLILENYWPLF